MALAAAGWLWALATVGVFALVTVLTELFSALGRRPGRVILTTSPPVHDAAFLEAVAAATNAPIRWGGTATLLNDGDEIFPAIFEAIEQARASVNVMAYIWRPGEVCDRMFDALVAARRRGIEVRVLIDGFGGRHTPQSHIRRLEEAGGVVVWFRPFRFGNLLRYHRRNHRRAVVVDGRIGFTGGAAFADEWLGSGQSPENWRDMMVRVAGPPARTLQAAFAQLWAQTCGEILVGETFYPTTDPPDRAGELITRHIGVTSSPGAEDHPLRVVFVSSFLAARSRLYVATSYFVPDETHMATLIERARAGVDVRFLLPGTHSDAQPVRWAGQRHFERLLESGVRIFEYRPTMMHAKTVVVDGVWSIVGSANLNQRSWELDEENVLAIHDVEFGTALEKRFLEDLERADELQLEAWRRRGPWPRARERLAAAFAQQF